MMEHQKGEIDRYISGMCDYIQKNADRHRKVLHKGKQQSLPPRQRNQLMGELSS
jgi:hypothetical protein